MADVMERVEVVQGDITKRAVDTVNKGQPGGG